MTTINTKIPDSILRRARMIAEDEEITLDQFIALALASQISSWSVGKTFNQRAGKGDWEKSLEILAKAPDTEPEDFDKI